MGCNILLICRFADILRAELPVITNALQYDSGSLEPVQTYGKSTVVTLVGFLRRKYCAARRL